MNIQGYGQSIGSGYNKEPLQTQQLGAEPNEKSQIEQLNDMSGATAQPSNEFLPSLQDIQAIQQTYEAQRVTADVKRPSSQYQVRVKEQTQQAIQVQEAYTKAQMINGPSMYGQSLDGQF